LRTSDTRLKLVQRTDEKVGRYNEVQILGTRFCVQTKSHEYFVRELKTLNRTGVRKYNKPDSFLSLTCRKKTNILDSWDI